MACTKCTKNMIVTNVTKSGVPCTEVGAILSDVGANMTNITGAI